MIADKLFSDFAFTATTSGSPTPTPLSASDVVVTVVNDPISNNFGFEFMFSLTAEPTTTNDIFLQYLVSTATGAPLITSEHLSQTGGFQGTGSAVVDETVCVGGAWSGAVCSGTPMSLHTFQNSLGVQLTDSITFGAVSQVGVKKDINVSGFSAGFASISGVSNTVDQVVPEPATMSLIGFGLLGLVYASRRRRRG